MADSEKVTGDMPLRLEWRSPAELTENPSNWRAHPEAQMTALGDVLGKVGWAGACLWNASSGRLIDGHARRKLAISRGDERIPVLVGSWTKEEERLILATLDPLAAMADTNEAVYRDLLTSVSKSNPDVMRALADIADQTLPEVLNVGVADLPALPSGDREPLQQMTFVLSDSQAGLVRDAISRAKAGGGGTSEENSNSNGNALACIAEAYIAGC